MSSQITPFLYDSLISASSTGTFIHKVTKWLRQFKASHPHIMLVQNKKEHATDLVVSLAAAAAAGS